MAGLSAGEPAFVVTLTEQFPLLKCFFRFDDDILEGQVVTVDMLKRSLSLGRGAACVFAPKRASKDRDLLLKEPDYVYPAVVNLAYGFMVGTQVWACLVWLLGTAVVFFLARVLNGDATYGGTLSITGYCSSPLLLLTFLSNLPHSGFLGYALRSTLKTACVCWGAYGAATVLVPPHLSNRRLLVLYPIVLFFLYMMSLCRAL